jgi:coenzyme F420-reducing hydrogenase delta subunit
MVKRLLEYIGLEPERFRMSWVSAAEGVKYTQVIKDFVRDIKPLGPQTKLRRNR